MLALFPNERVLTQSDNEAVTLTTHRILYEYKDWGKSYNQNIMLEHITSTENYSKSNVLLLILAILSGICSTAVMAGTPEIGLILILTGLVLYRLYRRSRKNLILISSPSTRMTINVGGMKREMVLTFINKVEQAKCARLSSIGASQIIP